MGVGRLILSFQSHTPRPEAPACPLGPPYKSLEVPPSAAAAIITDTHTNTHTQHHVSPTANNRKFRREEVWGGWLAGRGGLKQVDPTNNNRRWRMY